MPDLTDIGVHPTQQEEPRRQCTTPRLPRAVRGPLTVFTQRLRIKLLLVIIPTVYLALLTFPWAPSPTRVGLDSSWMLGLNMAHAAGLQFGKDVDWTFGPLAFLGTPDPISGAKYSSLGFRFAVYLVWLTGLVRLLLTFKSKGLVLWLGFVLVLSVIAYPFPAESDTLEIAILIFVLMPLLRFSRFRYAELAMTGVLGSVAVLMKFNLGVEYVLIFAAVFARVLWADRSKGLRIGWHAAASFLAMPLSFLILYVCVTGSGRSIWPFARWSFELASGYSEAMSIPGQTWQVGIALLSIVTILLVIPALAERPRPLLPSVIPAAAVLLFSFKYSFVRQDIIHVLFFLAKPAVAALFLLSCAAAVRDRRMIIAYQLLSFGLAFVVLIDASPQYQKVLRYQLQLRGVASSAKAFLHWSRTWDELASQRDSNLAVYRLGPRYQDIIGRESVNSLPYNVEVVEANGWNWRPSPVFQAYAAFTPALDTINAKQLETGGAQFVLLEWFAIDGRHQALEEPLLWRSLLDWYEVRSKNSNLLLLQRRPMPSLGRPTGSSSTVGQWDQQIELPPASGPLFMDVEVKTSFSGDLRKLLYRLEPANLEVTYRSGLKQTWRMVRPNLANGVLINFLPADFGAMEKLFRNHSAADPVVSICLHADRRQDYQPRFRIQFNELAASTETTLRASRAPEQPPSGRLAPIWMPGQPVSRCLGARCSPQAGSMAVFPYSGDSQVYFNARELLKNSQAIVIRARFQKADRMDFFFGKQVEGRGLGAFVPVTDKWVDVYIYASRNSFWEGEHGNEIRFDPASALGPGERIDIAGVWAYYGKVPSQADDIEFYMPHPVQQSKR